MKTRTLLLLAMMIGLLFPAMTGARQDQLELIKGTIQGTDGKPLKKVTTVYFLPKIPEGKSPSPKPLFTGVEPDGSFSIKLPLGDYMVSTNPPCYKLKDLTVTAADTLSLKLERKSKEELAANPGFLQAATIGKVTQGVGYTLVGIGKVMEVGKFVPHPGGLEYALKICGEGDKDEARPKNNN